jgi:aryl-alcohol dehydrogenase-like predicted oxidoreductase
MTSEPPAAHESPPRDGPAIPSSCLVRHPAFPFLLCRLGLATRGENRLTTDDIHHAVERGVNFLNWCGNPDALSWAVAGLGARRRQVAVCVQFEARTAAAAVAELALILRELHTDYVDVLTFYYVEEEAEWQQIVGPAGALEACRQAQRDGQVRLIGLTSHQRPQAASWAQTGLLDLLMIRYNAAHRGAETDVFPVTAALDMPVVAYTCLRWGALLRSTPEDPPGFAIPGAADWYRFVLQHPQVTVALAAPDNRGELSESLKVLDAPGPLTAAEFERLALHGQRVRKSAGRFP